MLLVSRTIFARLSVTKGFQFLAKKHVLGHLRARENGLSVKETRLSYEPPIEDTRECMGRQRQGKRDAGCSNVLLKCATANRMELS